MLTAEKQLDVRNRQIKRLKLMRLKKIPKVNGWNNTFLHQTRDEANVKPLRFGCGENRKSKAKRILERGRLIQSQLIQNPETVVKASVS